MAKMVMKIANATSPDELRRTFESAIAKTLAADACNPSRRPIAVRNRTIAPNDEAAEKRALTDAARALAQLWNISPTLIR
ncbi:MAG TPA: hypothetical protein VGM18_14275 [Candidatus Sulfotelmatobacter sp.]|jgi:hypothetical protein